MLQHIVQRGSESEACFFVLASLAKTHAPMPSALDGNSDAQMTVPLIAIRA